MLEDRILFEDPVVGLEDRDFQLDRMFVLSMKLEAVLIKTLVHGIWKTADRVCVDNKRSSHKLIPH